MQKTVTVIGRYRVYRGQTGVWWVASSTSGLQISMHKYRVLAEDAARRYAEGDQQRAEMRKAQHEQSR